VTEPTPPEVGRWTGMGEALVRFGLQTLAVIVGVCAFGALFAVATGHSVAGSIAAACYLIGALLFLVGMFPTGGFSMIRGTLTRRKPTGSRAEAQFLTGLALIAVGVFFDLTRPF
jgi:hypothetical protein